MIPLRLRQDSRQLHAYDALGAMRDWACCHSRLIFDSHRSSASTLTFTVTSCALLTITDTRAVEASAPGLEPKWLEPKWLRGLLVCWFVGLLVWLLGLLVAWLLGCLFLFLSSSLTRDAGACARRKHGGHRSPHYNSLAEKQVERLSSHGCSTESSTLGCPRTGSHLHCTIGASLPDAGCQPALTCREMLAVPPIHHKNGTGPPMNSGALLSRHSEGPFWSCESAVWVAGVASLARSSSRASTTPPLCSG